MHVRRNIQKKDLITACQFYAKQENRDYQYPSSLSGVQDNFGNSRVMASAIAALLTVWHQNFYRFGTFSQKLIERCIVNKLPLIKMLGR